jgi:hypothetical protein
MQLEALILEMKCERVLGVLRLLGFIYMLMAASDITSWRHVKRSEDIPLLTTLLSRLVHSQPHLSPSDFGV